MADIKNNGIVIRGKKYALKSALYNPFMSDPCDVCDLRRRWEGLSGNICEVFERKGRVSYFKEVEQGY